MDIQSESTKPPPKIPADEKMILKLLTKTDSIPSQENILLFTLEILSPKVYTINKGAVTQQD